ncbi:MAG: HlyC/CorC family transporter [Gammaproteobacteria bacterium]|nr:HlyC/CorC family transporter [Gammaproteobacteria bacterium]
MDGLQHELTQIWATIINYLTFDPARLLEPDMTLRLIVQVVLFICSAFFSGSETALFSLSRLDLQKLRKERSPHSESLHALLDQPRRLIMSILSGNELVNIAAAANMTTILIVLYGETKAGWINLLVMVPLILLFGEVTPKTIAVTNPVRISTRVVAPIMNFWVKIVFPLVWFIRAIADRITTWIVGEQKAAENILQIDEFRSLVEGVAKEGEINATERALIYNLLEAGDVEVVEIMTPRTRTCFINVELGVPEMVERFKAFRHPRVPVFRKHRDSLVGFLHCEDVLRLILDKEDLSKLTPDEIMHPPVVVPLTKKVDEMFDFFQNNQVRAAAVVNEFGGIEGIVTMKDVLTFIFGQISGEVTGEEHYLERDENVYEISGDMKLNDFNNLTNFGIEDPRMTTIGGVAFRHLDRLPQVGDQVTVEGITLSVLEMDVHRIARVRVARFSSGEEDSEGELEAQQDPPDHLVVSDLSKLPDIDEGGDHEPKTVTEKEAGEPVEPEEGKGDIEASAKNKSRNDRQDPKPRAAAGLRGD